MTGHPLSRRLSAVLGPYAHEPDMDNWPVLPVGQFTALHEIGQRRVAVVWHDDEDFPHLGLKPWFSLTCGILPTTLHTLWLEGLIRLDRKAGVYKLDANNLSIGRARLTPLGGRVLAVSR